jgi:hypothetical protein
MMMIMVDWNLLVNDYVHFVISFLILPLVIENLFLSIEYFQSIVYLNLFEINNHIQLNYIQKRLMLQMKPKKIKQMI